MLKLIFHSFPSGRAGIALVLIRFYVGIAFIQHGGGKLDDVAGFAAEYHLPWIVAAGTMVLQLTGGILLIIGLLTPLAALGIAGTMIGATLTLIQKGEPFINPAGHSWENSSFYFMLCVALSLLGAGAYSLDARLFGRGKEKIVYDGITT
ncbi:MAG: DoxX family protein [Blastocatellia bacterium]